MGASSSSEAEPKKEPMVEKPTETTALVEEAQSETEQKIEAAKKQMYTVLSLIIMIGTAVTKTQLTAALFHFHPAPTAYSMWTCVVTCILLVPVFIVKPSQWAVPTRAMAPVLSTIVVFTAFDLTFTNIALANISTALQQCIASTNPFWTIMIETVLTQKFQHPLVYILVTSVVFGAVMVGVTQFDRLNALGVGAAVVAVLCSACKYVFTHKTFQQFKGQIGALALLFWVDLFMFPITLAMAAFWEGRLDEFFEQMFTDIGVFSQFSGIAALGGLRALTQYVLLVFVTATSMSTANILTQILNTLISMTGIVPGQVVDINPGLIVGVIVVFISCALYAAVKSNKGCLPAVDEKARSMGCGMCVPAPPVPEEGTAKSGITERKGAAP